MNNRIKTEINDLRIAGLSTTDIARKLGLPRSTVNAHIRRHPEIPNTRECINCGKLVKQTPHHRARKFCSDQCRTEWWNHHPAAKSRPLQIALSCRQCGKEFFSYDSQNRKYCSRTCYDSARRRSSQSVQPQ